MTEPVRSYSTSEVAKRLGVATQTVQRWVDSGQLKAWKTVGGHRRIEAEGAEVLFRLHERGALGQEPSSDQPAQHTSSDPSWSVLIVDDNPDDRDILAQIIQDALPHSQIALATNGFHGLVALGRSAPDILITDVVMPHMNGFEMLRHLLNGCAIRPRLIIAVSSNSPTELASHGKLPDDVLFFQKPLEPDEFTAALHDALDRITL